MRRAQQQPTLPREAAALSARQQEILRLIAQGRSNREIAQQLGLTTGTVKQHVYALFRKLGVRNRTMAVARGGAALAPPETPGGAAEQSGLPDELLYARRLVTAVVVEPRPGAVPTSTQAADDERALQRLRERAARLALNVDARFEPLPGGGFAAWFGQPVAHGDDAARAVSFARALAAGADAAPALPISIGIATVPEVVGEGARSSLASRAYRAAMRLASAGAPGAPCACELTRELAGESEVDAWSDQREAAMAQVLPLQRRFSAARVREWGGLPFVVDLEASARRGRAQWLAVESWPPEAGTRLVDAVGGALTAKGLATCRLWVPAPVHAASREERILGQMQEEFRRLGRELRAASLEAAIAELVATGPAALIAYGIDSLSVLRAAFGDPALERLRSAPLVVVAGAMHRTGAPQTVVRLLGSHPVASPFVRVLRLEAPARSARITEAMRPDLQAVLDSVSARARAVARLASDPRYPDVGAVAERLGLAREEIIALCGELESCGLLSVREGRFEFRDGESAAAVRASLA